MHNATALEDYVKNSPSLLRTAYELIVLYDGSLFSGWLPNRTWSVQGVIENALELILRISPRGGRGPN